MKEMNAETEWTDCEKLKNLISEEIKGNPASGGMTDAELESLIFETVGKREECAALSFCDRMTLTEKVYSGIRGLDVLDPLLSDDSITEIMVNGPDSVYIERNGKTEKCSCRFESEEKLMNIIQRIVSNAGREVNTAVPIVDARLDDGSRVNVVLPPVSLCGPVLTVRKFPKEPMTVKRLIEYGSLTEEAAAFLEKLVAVGYNVFISGGTGSGKTSFLNALSDFIPSDSRVVTVEDSAELRISGIDNLVSLETRNANSSGNGLITVRNLIRTSLRMRPDRIIVGEVRGAEALDMLQAMNTGHDGSLSTGHANSSRDMLHRLETMVLEAGPGLPLTAIRSQIASALDIVVHLSRMRDKSRKVTEICEVCGIENGEIQLSTLFEYREDESDCFTVKGKLERTGVKLKNTRKLENAGMGAQI